MSIWFIIIIIIIDTEIEANDLCDLLILCFCCSQIIIIIIATIVGNENSLSKITTLVHFISFSISMHSVIWFFMLHMHYMRIEHIEKGDSSSSKTAGAAHCLFISNIIFSSSLNSRNEQNDERKQSETIDFSITSWFWFCYLGASHQASAHTHEKFENARK